jgi:hypothetical protein
MTAAELLENLRNRAFQIDTANNKLLVTPGSRLTDSDRAAIRIHVTEMVLLLEDEREWFEERSGILEYDGGLTRADAQVLADQLLNALRQRARGEPA